MHRVAPRVGAWIETRQKRKPTLTMRVAPRVGAWIETISILEEVKNAVVAPRVGAWIETRCLPTLQKSIWVAPRVGAWIETCWPCLNLGPIMSHPVWVRGLKPPLLLILRIRTKVAPRVGAWIETLATTSETPCPKSRTPCGCVD